jgi:hypothetical protein
MQNTTDRCKQLRKLHSRLTEEISALKETKQIMERESFDNPIETVNVINSLQDTLVAIDHELAKCPPEE